MLASDNWNVAYGLMSSDDSVNDHELLKCF